MRPLFPLSACAALLALPLMAPPAVAQALDARQTRALDCAAIFFTGAAELQRAGRIDANTAKVVQDVAKDMLKEVPGRRKAKTELVNARIQAMTKGKTSNQLLTDFGKRREACETEFLG